MVGTDQLSAVFSALADPTRRAIIAELAARDATVTELTAFSAGSSADVWSQLSTGTDDKPATGPDRMARYDGSQVDLPAAPAPAWLHRATADRGR